LLRTLPAAFQSSTICGKSVNLLTLIHGHHSIPCGEALIRFPQVPAIYMSHAFDFWMEAPIHFPQIAVYAAPGEACRDRLVHREGIA
jgi:hypothetical protein